MRSAGFACRPQAALDLEISRRLLAAIGHDLIFHLLSFIERAQARAFDRRNMDEHVLPACLRLNESVTLLRVEPLHRPERHVSISELRIEDSPRAPKCQSLSRTRLQEDWSKIGGRIVEERVHGSFVLQNRLRGCYPRSATELPFRWRTA